MNIDENYYKQIAIIKKNIENKNFEVAIDKLFELMDIYGKQENILFELGKTYFFCNKLSEAEKIFIDILKYKNKYSYIFLAKVLKYKNSKEDLEKAIFYLKQATNLFPNDIEIILELTECYLEIGNKEDFRKLMITIDIKEISKNNNLSPILVKILRKANLTEFAIKLSEQILKNNKNTEIEKEMVIDYVILGLHKEADKKLKKLIKKYPEEEIKIEKELQGIYRKMKDKELLLGINLRILKNNNHQNEEIIKETILLAEEYINDNKIKNAEIIAHKLYSVNKKI